MFTWGSGGSGQLGANRPITEMVYYYRVYYYRQEQLTAIELSNTLFEFQLGAQFTPITN